MRYKVLSTGIRTTGLLGCLALLGCTGARGLVTVAPGEPAGPAAPATPPVLTSHDVTLHGAAGLNLTVLGESFGLGGSVGEFTLEVSETASEVTATIRARDARALKALYVVLEYDPQRLNPQGGTPTLAMGPVLAADAPAGAAGLLSLSLNSERGRLHYGQVLARPQQRDGFSGSAALARFSFERGPAAEQDRQASTPPLTNGSQAPLNVQEGTFFYEWFYTNQGDYDQNSEVNIADLTPLAVHLGENPGGSGIFPATDVRSLIDGDSNGEINVADITPIGMNFGAVVQGWYMYQSESQNDYPSSNGAESSILSIGALAQSEALGNPVTERLHFSWDCPAPTDDSYYWVRPADATLIAGGSEGTPSQMDGLPAVVVNEKTRIIDGNPNDTPTGAPGDLAYDGDYNLISVDTHNTQFTIEPKAGAPPIEVGDILVGFIYLAGDDLPDGGYLVRVVAVTFDGTFWQIEADDSASLHDAIDKGGFQRPASNLDAGEVTDFTITLPHTGCVGSSPSSVSSIPVTRSVSDTVNFNLDGTVLVNEVDGESFLKISLPQANFNFGPTFGCGIDFDKFLGIPYDLNSFYAIASGGISNNLEIQLDAHWFTTFQEESLLYAVSKDQYFMIGPVPVVLTLRMDVYAGVSGEAGADAFARAGYNLNYGVALGITWDEDNGWGTVNECNDDFDVIPPEMRVDGFADVQVYLRPEFALELYHSIGIGIKVKPYASGHLDGNDDLIEGPYCVNWSIGGGLATDFRLYGKVLGISLFDETFPLFDVGFTLAEGTIGCDPTPKEPIAEFLTGDDSAFTVPHDIHLDAQFVPPAPPFGPRGSYDPDGGLLARYQWDVDNDGLVDVCDEQIITLTYTEFEVPRTISLWVTDDEGMVTKYTREVELSHAPT